MAGGLRESSDRASQLYWALIGNKEYNPVQCFDRTLLSTCKAKPPYRTFVEAFYRIFRKPARRRCKVQVATEQNGAIPVGGGCSGDGGDLGFLREDETFGL